MKTIKYSEALEIIKDADVLVCDNVAVNLSVDGEDFALSWNDDAGQEFFVSVNAEENEGATVKENSIAFIDNEGDLVEIFVFKAFNIEANIKE